MRKKRTGNYSDHPHVITNRPRPVVNRCRMTLDEFAARYHELSPVTAPEGSTVMVTLIDGAMRYEVLLPSVLINNGMKSEAR